MRKRKQRKNRVTGKATGKEKGEKKQRKGKWDFTYNSLKKKKTKTSETPKWLLLAQINLVYKQVTY